MSYRIFSLKDRSSSSNVRDFEEAAMMAKEGLDMMCELADEMKEKYGERREGSYWNRYGMRGSYGNRYGGRDEWEDDDMSYGERRRRDSRGRYI